MRNKVKKFKPPTMEEARVFADSIGFRTFEAEKWWFFYDSKNWMIGKNKMEHWKSAVWTWFVGTPEWREKKRREAEPDKAAEWEKEKQLVRDDRESWLRSKTLPALKDLAKDKKAHIYKVCGWLIEEILAEKKRKVGIK